MKEDQFTKDKLHLDAELKGIVARILLLKEILKNLFKIFVRQKHEYLLRVEQSANKGLVEENAKLFTQLQQLKQTLGDSEEEESQLASDFQEFRIMLQAKIEAKNVTSA